MHPEDPNVLLLRDAISHEPVNNRFVINPMVRVEGQDMRATKVLEQYAIQTHEKFKKGLRQTPLLVSGAVKVCTGCSNIACPTNMPVCITVHLHSTAAALRLQ